MKTIKRNGLEGRRDADGKLLPMRVEELLPYWSICITRDGRVDHVSPAEVLPTDEIDYDVPVSYMCGRCGEGDMDMWCSKHHDDSHIPIYLPKDLGREKGDEE